MAKHDPNDLPPPYYSVAVHTQPPLKPYEEVVYGGDGSVKPPSQLQYIPQYPPPVAAPTITQPSTLHSTKRRRCCQSNAQCFGGSGGTIVLVALLALAIWLGVRYGTRLATTAILYNGSEHNDVGTNENHPSMTHDTCSNNTVECDAKKDCQLGTDETSCVRFGQDNALQVKTAQDGRFLPVCHDGWDQSYADQTCAQLGFRRSHATKAVDSQESIGLTLASRSSQPIQGLVSVSASCPDKKAVSLQCVDCGQQSSTSRIIGGSIAKVGQWPWQLSLHFRGFHTCGGVLISPDFVVTAAHCFPRTNPSALNVRNWRVYGGMVSQDSLPAPYLVERILLNENYNNKTNDQDIALLKLTAPVEFNNAVRPACLPAFDQIFSPGTKCWTSGFGTTEAGAARGSKDLMEVTVDIIDRTVCNSRNVYRGAVSKNMLCAGDLNGGKDSCQGDSGGPLVCQGNDQRWYVVGITSWGESCGLRNKPGVYTNVPEVLPWIYSKMQQVRP
ncbi:transmembrane protease serine 13a [Myripristis murdjan]|uniref:transmembrane protease serine 13a n=1 Tax=Myripristis murdjan TaxID=586833 RepID=UPI00117606BC|nr:transmembrane protease serine 13-like [Myripristis murdjan]